MAYSPYLRPISPMQCFYRPYIEKGAVGVSIPVLIVHQLLQLRNKSILIV